MQINPQLQATYDSQYLNQQQEWRTIGAKYKFENIKNITQNQTFETVIEIGAGDGSILALMNEYPNFSRLYAVEISTSGLEAINQRKLSKLEQASLFDGYKTHYPDDFFDLAILSHVLEHVEYERPLLREMKRISKNQIIEVPRDYRFDADKRIKHYLNYGHINLYTPTSLRFLLKSEGFQLLKTMALPIPKQVWNYVYNQNKKQKTPLKFLKHQLTFWFKTLLSKIPFRLLNEYACNSITILCSKGTENIKIF